MLLEPTGNPAYRTYQKALFEQGIPLTSFAVEEIRKEHERMIGVAFRMEPTRMGDVTAAVFRGYLR